MTLSIYKYKISAKQGMATAWMPKGAQIKHVEEQAGILCAWAIVDPIERQHELRHFLILGTGQAFDKTDLDRMKHITTFQSGIFVWHVFEWDSQEKVAEK